jgi:hypothetical protein
MYMANGRSVVEKWRLSQGAHPTTNGKHQLSVETQSHILRRTSPEKTDSDMEPKNKYSTSTCTRNAITVKHLLMNAANQLNQKVTFHAKTFIPVM